MSTSSQPPPAAGTPSPKPRPGLLVEDRNAAVRTNSDGQQTVVKVPSRAEEAARQGVDESRI
jgi:hypothetical protein